MDNPSTTSGLNAFSRRRNRLRVLFFTFALLAFYNSFLQAAPSGVLVVLVNRLSLDDARKDSNLNRLVAESAIGLISPLSLDGKTIGAVHASMAAGVKSAGGPEYGLVMDFDEQLEQFEGSGFASPAADVYARRTGYAPPEEGLVHIGLPQVVAANERLGFQIETWGLGKALREAKVLRAAFGNADTGIDPKRFGAAMLTDTHGIILRGRIGRSTLSSDPAFPGGYRTDIDTLDPLLREQLKDEAVVLLEWGDLERLESERGFCTPAAYRLARRTSIGQLGKWLALVQKDFPEVPVLILSPVPQLSNDGQWNTLGLILLHSKDTPPGLLTSNGTRTRGVVTTLDISPTILNLVQVDTPKAMVGYPVRSISSNDSRAEIERWNLTVALNREVRFPFILSIGILAAVVGVYATTILARSKQSNANPKGPLVALGVISWIPAIFLIPMDRIEWLGALPLLVIAAFALSAAVKHSNRFLPVEVPAVALLLGCALSVTNILDWMQRSILCSNLHAGHRFYGMGNEFMGCIVAAITIIPMWRKARGLTLPSLWIIASFYLFWIVLIGLPSIGADLGGAITATAASLLSLRYLAGQRLTWVAVFAAFFSGIIVGILIMLLDALISPSPSHLGALTQELADGNASMILDTIVRKLSLMFHLWTNKEARITMAVFGSVLLTWFAFRNKLTGVFPPSGPLRDVVNIVLVSGIIAILINDSGMVAFAFMLAYLMTWLLWDALTGRMGGSLSIRFTRAHSRR